MNKLFLILSATAINCAFAVTSQAQTSINVPNFSFENGYSSPNNYGGVPNNYAFSGQVYAIPGTYSPSSGNFPAGAPQGSQILYFNIVGNGASATVTTDTTLASIDSGASYRFTIAVGNPKGTGEYQTSGNAVLSILANNMVVATRTVDTTTIADGTFQDFAVNLDGSLTAGLANQALTVQISTFYTGDGSHFQQGTFDNVRLDEFAAGVVPEPAVWGLSGAGFCLLSLIFRRRARSA